MPAANVNLLFRAFSDRTRLRILNVLRRGEVCVGNLVKVLGVPQPTASRHLAYLRRAGFESMRAAYAADHLHVSYLCRPTQPLAHALPDLASVTELFREIRYVQNAPRPA